MLPCSEISLWVGEAANSRAMNEQEILNLLYTNISYQLRHAHYARTVYVAQQCHMMTTGEGQAEEITRYRRFEKDELKEQRIRLNNPITPIFISEPDKMFDKLTRVDGVRRDLEAGEKEKQELEATLWNFQPGVDIETYLVNRIRYLGKNDPNSFVLFDRYDRRRMDNEIEKTTLRPVVFRSTDVLNFEQDGEGFLVWVLFRDIRFEYVIESGYRREKQLETYYLYTSDFVARAREVGEKTEMMPGEFEQDIEVFPAFAEHDKKKKDDGTASIPIPNNSPQTRRFFVSVTMHGAGEVPAFCVGAYPDELTDQQTFVSWFWPGMPVLKDVIRDKQMKDVETVMQAFRRRTEYSPPCKYESDDGSICDDGKIFSEGKKIRCPSCGGSGKRANFTTEQEVIQLLLPHDPNPETLLELSKLAFEEQRDTNILEYFGKEIETHRQRFLAAIFSGGLFTKPTGTEAQTATETIEKTNMAADILRPFGLVISKGYEMAFRVLANYREYAPIKVNHSYPEQIDLLTLEQEIANFAAIQEVDIYESKVHQRHKILAKQFEGEPETHKRIQARYTWLPFDALSPEQQMLEMSRLSPTDSNAILQTYHKMIFQEIEVETPNFHTLKFEAQKKIVEAKVDEFRGRIELAGSAEPEMPDFNAPDDDEEFPNETGNE